MLWRNFVAAMWVAGFFMVAWSGSAAAQDSVELNTVVVTGTRDDQNLSESTKSISVVTKEDMDSQQNYFIPKYLAQQPGVFYTNNGSMGQWSTVSIRGTGAKYTQFQFNGIPLQDVADTQGAFTGFIEDLNGASNIRQIEVLRGTSSTLHGSRAIGGVINITTDRWIDGLKAEWRNEFGANNTYVGNARIAYGQSDKFYFDINPVYADTDGEQYVGKYGLGYDNKGFSASAGLKPFENASLEFMSLYYESNMDSSNSPRMVNGKLRPQEVVNPANHRESIMSQMGLNWQHEVNDAWDYHIKASYGETERHYFTQRTGGTDLGFYDGETTYLEMQHNIHPVDWLTVNIGADFQHLVYKQTQTPNSSSGNFDKMHKQWSYDSYDPFLQLQGVFLDRRLFTNVGARYTKYSEFGGKMVWDASAAYLFDTGTKIHVQAATGYRAPSLYELFGGYLDSGVFKIIGNENLKPEESTSFEVGVEQNLWDDRVNVGLTYFHTDVDDIIYYGYVRPGYEQGSKGKVKGVESWISARPIDRMKLTLAYTYVDSKYQNTPGGQWFRTANLPHQVFNFNVTATPIDDLTLSLNLARRGKTPVSVSSTVYQESASTVVDVAAGYAITEHMEIFARLDNLFDEEYTVGAYSQPGASFYGGVKFSY